MASDQVHDRAPEEAVRAAAESLRLGGSAQLGHDIGKGGRENVGRKVVEAALPSLRRAFVAETAEAARQEAAGKNVGPASYYEFVADWLESREESR